MQRLLSSKLDDVVNSVTKNAVCLKGILASPVTGDLTSTNYRFRSDLDLFANVVHIKSLPGIKSRHKNIDLVIVREQTEGEFSCLEHETGNNHQNKYTICFIIYQANVVISSVILYSSWSCRML